MPSRLRRLAAIAAALLSLSSGAFAKPMPSMFIEDYTTAELKAWLAAAPPASPRLALVFNSGVEETGPHVAVGKHIFRVRAYSQAIAKGLGGTLVAPIFPFAPNPPDLASFPGTFSVDAATFVAVNEQVKRSLISGGFKRIALLGDHGPGQKDLGELAKRLDAEYAASGVRIFYIADGYIKARMQIESDLIAAGKGRFVGHGGLWDTAETMAVKPDAVRPKMFWPKGDYSEKGNGPYDAQGVNADARGATAAIGRSYGALRVKLAIEEIRRDLAQAPQVAVAPVTDATAH